MKRILYFIFTASIIMLLSGNTDLANASYTTVWSFQSGELTLNFTGWDNEYYEDPSGDYRIAKLDFQLSNPVANTSTYSDVNMVLPFVWEQFTPTATPNWQASSWDNANQEWINDYAGTNVYVKVASDPDSPSYSYLAINQTDIPTTSASYSGFELAYVSSSDSLPAWALASSFAPGDSMAFSIYLEYERNTSDPTSAAGLQIDPFVVASAVPIPSAVWLLGSGLIGIVGFRKKPRKEV